MPGNPPFGIGNLKAVYNIGEFARAQGAINSNPYTLTIGPNNDFFIVDAGFNGIIRRNRNTGALSVFARFDPIPNPTPIGPPVIDAVPTGIVFASNRFYVAAFTGFPFVEGLARIYEVDLNGNVSVFKDGLTSVVDLTIDPRDRSLVFLQFARWNFPFVPFTGGVFKLKAGKVDTIAFGLNFTAGLRFNTNDDLFVSSITDGQILKITFPVTAVETRPSQGLPKEFGLAQNYPNPFPANGKTRISYQLAKPGRVVVKVFNLMGQEVRTLINEFKPAGAFEMLWDGKDNAGRQLSTGTYLYQIEAQRLVQTKKMVLLQ